MARHERFTPPKRLMFVTATATATPGALDTGAQGASKRMFFSTHNRSLKPFQKLVGEFGGQHCKL